MSHVTITVSDLARELAATPGRTVIDVRTPVEYAEVHAVPARNLPLPDISAAALASVGHTDPAAPVYLLCRTDRRATAAADKLAAAGFKQLVVVAGGTEAWVAADLPVTRAATKTSSGQR